MTEQDIDATFFKKGTFRDQKRVTRNLKYDSKLLKIP